MGFSANDGDVRVDIFKQSGKWYETVSVDCEGSGGFDAQPTEIHDVLRKALKKEFPHYFDPGSHQGWFAVCLEPYHKHSHPIVIWLGARERCDVPSCDDGRICGNPSLDGHPSLRSKTPVGRND